MRQQYSNSQIDGERKNLSKAKFLEFLCVSHPTEKGDNDYQRPIVLNSLTFNQTYINTQKTR